MGHKPRQPSHLWVLESDLGEVHAARIVSPMGLWDIDAVCGAELDLSSPAKSDDPKPCGECAEILKQHKKKAIYR